ncbi:MAG: hypothetical protein ABSH13_01705 [Candidatus Acidiferrum sp.]|jgi:hypothetical protein
MFLAVFNFAGRLNWRFDNEDASRFPLSGTSDWALVNPLVYHKLPIFQRTEVLPVSPKLHFCFNSEIVLASEKTEPSEKKVDDLIPIVGKLLVRLRLLSRQAALPGPEDLMMTGIAEVNELPQLTFDLSPSPAGRIQKYLLETAITAEQIGAVIALAPDFIPPTHELLLMDAITAYGEKDHRRAILYAAISAEVALGFVIEDAYERVRGGPADERFRIVELPQGDRTIRKDPVYERLRSRPDFGVFLHELSLYILRRSLLEENQALYADAKRLYLTRNQLVHLGGLAETEPSQPYKLDARGATAALKTATALFTWLGLRDNFPLPDGKFVPIVST